MECGIEQDMGLLKICPNQLPDMRLVVKRATSVKIMLDRLDILNICICKYAPLFPPILSYIDLRLETANVVLDWSFD